MKERAGIWSLGAIAAAFCFLGGYNPVFNLPASILAGGALCAFMLMTGPFTGLLSLASGVAVMGLFRIPWGATASSVVTVAAISYALYGTLRRKMSFKGVMLITFLAAGAATLSLHLLSAYITYGVITPKSVMAPFDLMLEAVYDQLLSTGSAAGAARQTVDAVRSYINNMLVGYIALTAWILAFFSFLYCRLLCRWLFKEEHPSFDFLQNFYMDKIGGIIYTAVFFLSIFIPKGLFGAITDNYIMIMGPAFFLEGVSLLGFAMDKVNMTRGRGSILFICLIFSVVFPYLSVMLAAMGAIDAAFDYRKLNT